ncbi:hypothetical protein KDA23_01145 [Candidatus Saccharibacteria bacterium]|nr:hypothetical protein [Candidatus Saccharibacteria bacterium]
MSGSTESSSGISTEVLDLVAACDPLPEELALRDRPVGVTRRTVLRAGLAATVGLGAVGRAINRASNLYEDARWPIEEASIALAAGSESLPKGGAESLVFMGFGQQDAHNAAHQLFHALEGRQAVAGIRYPSRSFTPSTLAPVIADYIQQRRMSKLTLVGVSMGTAIALESMRHVYLSKLPWTKMRDGIDDGGVTELPVIDYMVAYSSPSDLADAYESELATFGMVLKKLGYKGDTIGKFGFGLYDALKDADPAERLQFRTMVRSAIDEATNHSPPEMCVSQIQILSAFNLRQQAAQRYGQFIQPPARMIYVAADHDKVVDDNRAIDNFSAASRAMNLAPIEVLSSERGGHANTTAAANALGAYLLSLST